MAEQVDKEAIESVLQGDLREARDTIGKNELLIMITKTLSAIYIVNSFNSPRRLKG